MDIPDTGAIFTLGRSHLAENAQSYFFIKNDPVKRLTSGTNQSAVICESGRLFVWGENQFGQLGIGGTNGTEIVTKPTCVKSLKALGLRAADVAFGAGWSVTLTHSDEIFFTGRNIFTEDSASFHHLSSVEIAGEQFSISRKPFRLEEFDGLLEDNKEEHFQKLSAGNDHFVVLTSQGRLFGWGCNESNQLGLEDTNLLVPVEVTVEGKIKDISCGPQSTLLLTEKNQLFLAGRLNDFHFQTFTELILNISSEPRTFLYISKANEVFVITESGNIYKSNESVRNKKLIFQKFYDYDNEENGPAMTLLKGNLFFAALTRKNKFFTTFSESGHHLKTFREITKFKNLRILDIAVGDKHVLVFGVPKTAKNVDSNFILNQTYTAAPKLNGVVKEISAIEKEPIDEEGNDLKLKNRKEGDPNGNPTERTASNGANLNGNSLIKESNFESVENNETIKREQTPDKINNNSVASSQSNLYTDNYEFKSGTLDGAQNEIVEATKPVKAVEEEGHVEEEKHVVAEEQVSKEEISTLVGISSAVNKNATTSPSHKTDANQLHEDTNVTTAGTLKSEGNMSAEQLPDNGDKNGNAEDRDYKNVDNERAEKWNENEKSIKTKQSLSPESLNEITSDKFNSSDAETIVTKSDNLVNEKETTLDGEDADVFNALTKSPKPSRGVNLVNDLQTKPPSPNGENNKEEITIKNEKEMSPKQIHSSEITNNTSDNVLISPEMSNKDLKEGKVFEKPPATAKDPFLKILQYSESPFRQKSPRSAEKSIKFDEKSLKSQKSQERLLRPRTPYPDSKQSTPQTIKKNLISGQDVEGFEKESLSDIPEKPSSSRRQSLRYSDRGLKKEYVDEITRKLTVQTPAVTEKYLDLDDYAKDDENLVVEISTSDILDKTVVNEIRFINNGVDVTEKVIDNIEKERALNIEQKLLGNDPVTDIPRSANQFYKDITRPDSTKTSESASQKSRDLKLKSSEEDERTTASVNSNISGNPSDAGSEVSVNVQDTKRNVIQNGEEQGSTNKGRVKQFITDIKNKGKDMSCRSHHSVKVEDEPPVYSPVDQRFDNKTSKVCNIL